MRLIPRPSRQLRAGTNLTAAAVAVIVCVVVLILARLNHHNTPPAAAAHAAAPAPSVSTVQVSPTTAPKPTATRSAPPRRTAADAALRFAADWGTLPAGWDQAQWLHRLQHDGVTGNLVQQFSHMLPQEIHAGTPHAVHVLASSPAVSIVQVALTRVTVNITVLTGRRALVDNVEPAG